MQDGLLNGLLQAEYTVVRLAVGQTADGLCVSVKPRRDYEERPVTAHPAVTGPRFTLICLYPTLHARPCHTSYESMIRYRQRTFLDSYSVTRSASPARSRCPHSLSESSALPSTIRAR